jgi:hypothetical protein
MIYVSHDLYRTEKPLQMPATLRFHSETFKIPPFPANAFTDFFLYFFSAHACSDRSCRFPLSSLPQQYQLKSLSFEHCNY